jgi:hypothetical protein
MKIPDITVINSVCVMFRPRYVPNAVISNNLVLVHLTTVPIPFHKCELCRQHEVSTKRCNYYNKNSNDTTHDCWIRAEFKLAGGNIKTPLRNYDV